MWIGLLSGGVAVYDKGTFRSFGPNEGLTGGTVLSILEDAKGAVWFATSTVSAASRTDT